MKVKTDLEFGAADNSFGQRMKDQGEEMFGIHTNAPTILTTPLSKKYSLRSKTACTTETPQNAPIKVHNQTSSVEIFRPALRRYPRHQLSQGGSVYSHGAGTNGFRYVSMSKSSFIAKNGRCGEAEERDEDEERVKGGSGGKARRIEQDLTRW